MSAGTRLVQGVSIIIRRGNQYLLLKRTARTRYFAEKWECVSGKIEPEETPHQAAVREVREETGLDVQLDQEPITFVQTKLGENELHLTYFHGDYRGGEVQLSHEHCEAGWFDADEVAVLNVHTETIELIRGQEGSRSGKDRQSA